MTHTLSIPYAVSDVPTFETGDQILIDGTLNKCIAAHEYPDRNEYTFVEVAP